MPSFPRRRVLQCLIATSLALAGGAFAQPAKVVKVLVGFPAGGGTDAIARLLAERLKDELGATVVVENKPGAGGQLAAQALKASPADGSTFFISHDHTISILPLVMKNPGFDSARDFVPVAGFATFVNAFAVSPGTPAKTLPEYVAWIQGNGQGKGVVGVPAPASTPEFLVKLLGERFKLDLVPAPYRGSAPMLADMLGNQIASGIGSVPDFIETHKSGRIRVIAVAGSARQAILPDVPTLAELGIAGFDEPPYYAFFAPAGTPKPALDAFARALSNVVKVPEVRERLTALGLAVEFMPAEQLASRERAYAKSWAEIIRRTGFAPQ
ncbi:MAG: Bug family tripartite tricarboxylate transporter substrate binding protein [Burkholderiaceae bacterium]